MPEDRPTPKVAIAPAAPKSIRAAVERGGGTVVEPDQMAADADALVWLDFRRMDDLASLLDTAPHVRWVQLPSAGIELFAQAGVFDDRYVWTSAKGAYAEPVAEHALALG